MGHTTPLGAEAYWDCQSFDLVEEGLKPSREPRSFLSHHRDTESTEKPKSLWCLRVLRPSVVSFVSFGVTASAVVCGNG